ncbi:hypothetical protein FB567DRAFT_539668 [Paraphoma chrysanthemicola]|uniref:Glycosyl hydrolase family 63 N-terminal domain-containing protein n=1 Tax=Paraphoma chrysanthemicola TaxID=798071 RepID=A0A8K0QTV6_9PLEO|nr:hypothetical protein FB567DRAFT_539668 [Paraphoma chrysanthemicola]
MPPLLRIVSSTPYFMMVYRLNFFWLLWLQYCSVAINATNTSWLTWGPYRPNLYFGVRPSIPDSFLMGLMWTKGEDLDSLPRLIYRRPSRHL